MDAGIIIWWSIGEELKKDLIMKRFFARIRDKAKNVSQKPVLIAALGDSVTQGVMEHRMLDSERVYHRLLQEELEAFFPLTTFSTINAGVSGGSALQAVERLDRDVLRHDPDLVLVAFGLNDSLGGVEALPQFEVALHEIITQIENGTSANIMLLTPSFMAKARNTRIHRDHDHMAENIIRTQNEGILSRYAQAIRSVSAQRKTGLADVYREWERLSEDGLDTDLWLINGLNHPDGRGHKLASQILAQVLFSALRRMDVSLELS